MVTPLVRMSACGRMSLPEPLAVRLDALQARGFRLSTWFNAELPNAVARYPVAALRFERLTPARSLSLVLTADSQALLYPYRKHRRASTLLTQLLQEQLPELEAQYV